MGAGQVPQYEAFACAERGNCERLVEIAGSFVLGLAKSLLEDAACVDARARLPAATLPDWVRLGRVPIRCSPLQFAGSATRPDEAEIASVVRGVDARRRPRLFPRAPLPTSSAARSVTLGSMAQLEEAGLEVTPTSRKRVRNME